MICNDHCRKENEYLVERARTLSNSLAKSIQPVDIRADKIQKVNPIKIIDNIDDIVIADCPYLAFDYDSWRSNLLRIYRELRNKLSYTSDIFDCDDFSLIFASTVAYSAYKSGWNIQPAFCIIWSANHAFCGFICDNDELFIYEPQNDTVIGKIDEELGGKMYKARKIWFMS